VDLNNLEEKLEIFKIKKKLSKLKKEKIIL